MKEVKGGRDLSQLRKHENSAGLPGTGVVLSQFCLSSIGYYFVLYLDHNVCTVAQKPCLILLACQDVQNVLGPTVTNVLDNLWWFQVHTPIKVKICMQHHGLTSRIL